MLLDNEQAEAYAFLAGAIEDINMLLNVVEGGFLEEDWAIVKRMGKNLQGAKDMLEP